MSDFSVKFIGGEYALPSELKEYLKICDKFSQISQFLSNALLETMQISSIIDGKPCQVGANENELKEKMHNEGKKIISMLSEYGVYDITDSDIFENNKGYLKYVDAYKNMMKGLSSNLAEEIQSFIDGYDNVQRSAYSQVTGTGISMYSSSLVAHMTLAALEANT